MIERSKVRAADRQGIVLFLVVSIVLMLTLLTYGFLVSMRTQNLAAAQAGDQHQARQAAFSARELVCAILESPYSVRYELEQNGNGDQMFRDIKLDAVENDGSDEFLSAGFVVRRLTAGNDTGQGNASNVYGFVNESSKINLRLLLANDEKNPGWGRATLMRLPNMTETIADHILDWMDSDDEPREFGNESDFYLENSLTPPRNDVPTELRELAMIPDVSLEMVVGANNESARRTEKSTQRSTDDPSVGLGISWSDFLTVRSGERNETIDGNARINLNSSDLFELHNRLTELTSVEIGNYVILVRQYGLSEASNSDEPASLQSAGQVQIDFTVSPSYEIESKLDILNSLVQIGDDEDAIWVRSPMSQTGSTLDDVILRFLDGCTTSPQSSIQGRVNIALARREVLLSVPGVDESLADQITSSRESLGENGRSCFWLLENGLVNMEQMKQLEPWITSRGEVCRFICGGQSDRNSAPLVYEVILDATDGVSKQLFCRRILETGAIANEISASRGDRK